MAKNIFSDCKTPTELYDAYDYRMSPENLSCDGERSHSEIQRVAQRLDADFKARLKELSF